MKKITFIFAFLIATTFCFGQNLLLEGGFEGMATGTPATPWSTGQAAQTTINNNAAVAHSGDQFLNFNNDFRNIRQSFTAEAGKTYTLKLWNQFVGGQGLPASTDGIFVSIRQNIGTNGTPFDPNIGFYIDPSVGNLDWTEFTLDFTAPETDLMLYIFKQSRVPNTNPNNATRLDDFSIVLNSTASVKDLNQFNFSAYPNPASHNLNLSASKNIETIEIFNLIGQKVMTATPNKNATSINVSNLNSGIYIVKATIEGIKGSYKFVKQ
jgi:hypothetical protein